ncbi:hypothetical protein LOK46_01120 [Methylobacterium sp. NMS14P]|uniref:hypothetical protein n=1 Tax=Methylobacterium sp. NMS14P TaxID=2894310 RepID=UPI002358501D|nr:hypothetical protein [Methylobacterium sp. NMS14P]WCS25472.1 hypothetical protein LOK46_01120 [Methylobacterium sp. NMS14P]
MPDFTLHYGSPAWRSAILGSDALGLPGVAPAGAGTSDALAFTGPIQRGNNQMVSGASLI